MPQILDPILISYDKKITLISCVRFENIKILQYICDNVIGYHFVMLALINLYTSVLPVLILIHDYSRHDVI